LGFPVIGITGSYLAGKSFKRACLLTNRLQNSRLHADFRCHNIAPKAFLGWLGRCYLGAQPRTLQMMSVQRPNAGNRCMVLCAKDYGDGALSQPGKNGVRPSQAMSVRNDARNIIKRNTAYLVPFLCDEKETAVDGNM
jgi:hypothetical protein